MQKLIAHAPLEKMAPKKNHLGTEENKMPSKSDKCLDTTI
jgi:hypothetical protein